MRELRFLKYHIEVKIFTNVINGNVRQTSGPEKASITLFLVFSDGCRLKYNPKLRVHFNQTIHELA